MPKSKFDYDVFISYSHKDEEWVRRKLLPTLEKQGVKVCIDFRDFAPGKAAVLNMQDASARSRHTLLVLTPDWLSSEWTMYESLLSRSEDPAGLQQRTIPLMVKRCTPPPFLSLLTWVDFTDPRREKEAWQSLFRALNKNVERLTISRYKEKKTATKSGEQSGKSITININQDMVDGIIVIGNQNTITTSGKKKQKANSEKAEE